VASLDGTRVVRGERVGPVSEARSVGESLGDELLSKGAAEILRECEALQVVAPQQ
jgi:hydroxymethylbilane synthase